MMLENHRTQSISRTLHVIMAAYAADFTEGTDMTTQYDKATAFVALHRRPGAFVIPNPWDAGSARLLAALGFEALATTSGGYANALGRVDGQVQLDEKVAHCRALCAATALPVSADLENCYADAPEAAARNLLLAAESGIAGASIEDYSGDPARGIYDFELAVERVQAAVEAVRSLPYPFVLTARAENLLRGRDDLDDTIRRLQAYAAAGADVLFAPGLTTIDQVRTVTAAVSLPVNVLAPQIKGITVAALAEAGVKRISLGSTLARAASGALLRAARELQGSGGFSWTGDLASVSEIERLLGQGAG